MAMLYEAPNASIQMYGHLGVLFETSDESTRTIRDCEGRPSAASTWSKDAHRTRELLQIADLERASSRQSVPKLCLRLVSLGRRLARRVANANDVIPILIH
jgi:hypothetical protein